MQVASINDVKIYNLSAGKSIPEWMNSEARRRAERKSIDVRRRVQLIQDFEMPDVSHTINISRDGRYVFATGIIYPSVLLRFNLSKDGMIHVWNMLLQSRRCITAKFLLPCVRFLVRSS
ncbi:hypothetical protein Y032_0051g2164 [Ancylostoma ceylanicum]|uniref:Nucleolar protein 10-like N-terminal domain-containing protein n=1 Tax=Ancylostoma ceylanicum TaxID=53326 RepID=A0A016U9R8_9BILA|nr:hypothetical protein Y032_0051g2164 [Ancylostoma ceylanicum]